MKRVTADRPVFIKIPPDKGVSPASKAFRLNNGQLPGWQAR
jgi:hypothetical protein